MQESLLNTVKKMQTEQKVNIEELEIILNSDIEQVVALCKRACLKPKTEFRFKFITEHAQFVKDLFV